MFTCNSCHADCKKCSWLCQGPFSKSLGPCEVCGKVDECHDCHCDCKPRKKEKRV